MALKYDDKIGMYGPRFNGEYYTYDGIYMTPKGELFNADRYSRTAHSYGMIIPFLKNYLYSHEHGGSFIEYTKEHLLTSLLNWKQILTKKYFDDNDNAINMALAIVNYFINCYTSSLTEIKQIGRKEYYSDLSKVIGVTVKDQIHEGRYLLLKEILVQACNYDAVESQVKRTITTSKFNINEVFMIIY